MADYAVAHGVCEIQALAMLGEEVHDTERVHLMLERSQSPLLRQPRYYPLPYVAEGRMS